MCVQAGADLRLHLSVLMGQSPVKGQVNRLMLPWDTQPGWQVYTICSPGSQDVFKGETMANGKSSGLGQAEIKHKAVKKPVFAFLSLASTEMKTV